MSRSSLWLLLCLVVFTGLLVQALAATPDDPAKVEQKKKAAKALEGKPAPSFKPDFALNGKPVSLEDLKGKVVVLEFWTIWCPWCIQSLPPARDLHAKYKDKPVAVLGVTTYFEDYAFDKKSKKVMAFPQPLTPKQERAAMKDFAAFHNLEYPLLFLPGKEWDRVSNSYSRGSVPSWFIIDKKGIIRYFQGGYSPQTVAIFEKIIDPLLAEE